MHFYESDPGKDRGYVWESGDDAGRQGVKILFEYQGDIRRISAIKQSDGTVTGNRTRVKVVKNKVAPPFTEAEFDIMYNEGISNVGALLDLALEKNILEKRGSWISYKGQQLAQGRDAAKEALRADTRGPPRARDRARAVSMSAPTTIAMGSRSTCFANSSSASRCFSTVSSSRYLRKIDSASPCEKLFTSIE